MLQRIVRALLAAGCVACSSNGVYDPALPPQPVAGSSSTPAASQTGSAGRMSQVAAAVGGAALPVAAAPPLSAAAPSAGSGGAPAVSRMGMSDWAAGDYPADLTGPDYLEIKDVAGQQGLARQYKVHVPASYQRDRPMPLVFCIHGLFQDPVMFCLSGAGFDKVSDQEGFILVLPLGYSNSWNAGTCCGDARDMKLDDVALFRAILAEVGTHLNIDRDRVYATGLSNGGYMSYRLACEAADVFAAVAAGAGAIGINEFPDKTEANPDLLSWTSNFSACAPSRPLSILHIHGTADELIPYSLQPKSLALGARLMGCGSSTKPAGQPMSAGDTSCVTYEGCPTGIEVTGCTVQGGGHCWFGSADCGTGAGDLGSLFVGANSDSMKNNEAVVTFLRAHKR